MQHPALILDLLSPVHRSFSILNHYLKRAPNARLHALSAYLRGKLNPSTITVEVYAEKKKMATSELYVNGRWVDGRWRRGRYKNEAGPSIGQDIDATYERRMALSKGRMATSVEEAEELATEAAADEGDMAYLEPAEDREVNVVAQVVDYDEEDAVPPLVDEEEEEEEEEDDHAGHAMGDEDIHSAEQAAELLEQHMVDSHEVVSYKCCSCGKDVTGQLEDCETIEGRYGCADCQDFMTTTFILEGVPDYNDDEDTCEGALTL